MEPEDGLAALLELKAGAAQKRYLAEHAPSWDLEARDQLAAALKKQADRLIRTDTQGCFRMAELLDCLAEYCGNALYHALGLLARANAHTLDLGEYRQGIECYNAAAEIYAAHGKTKEQAQAQIGKIYALGVLGRFEEAERDFEWARQALREAGEWLLLAKLKVNMGILYGQRGMFPQALEMFALAQEAYRQLGPEGELPGLRLEINRAVALRNLGRFEEAIAASQGLIETFRQRGLEVDVASAQQNLAMTYLVLGRFNETLALLEEVGRTFRQAGMGRHAVLVELFIGDCLLQLRRFPDVLEKSAQARRTFEGLGASSDVAQALLTEASAYLELGRLPEALDSLAEAREIFHAAGNRTGAAGSDLQEAGVRLGMGQPAEALDLALRSAEIFRQSDLPVWEARAFLAAARAVLGQGDARAARAYAGKALATGQESNLPDLCFLAQHVLAQLAVQQGEPGLGLEAYRRAADELERLCGRLMVEFRSDFVADKERIYAEAVALCLDLDYPQEGLEFAERAKSRALLDLLTFRLDLSITARSAADQPLVEELTGLRVERDRLYRQLEVGEGFGQRGGDSTLLDERAQATQRVLAIEKQITTLWHQLLVRNADYAREAALWQVRTEPVQPALEAGELLVEYFFTPQGLGVFLATRERLWARRLGVEREAVQRLVQLLWLNLKSVASAPERAGALEANIQGVLGKLYAALVAPLEAESQAAGATRWIVAPHGPLHYLPFGALYDGQQYLLEKVELSFLPGASLLRFYRAPRPAGGGLLAVGHSFGKRLPFALEEAQEVAARWDGAALLEEQATLAQFRARAPGEKVLHLATHADFRPDNPLFSGLALADGWLTTLDIFNLRLQASLVTLSACQTGRSVVGGGDELLGLMRSFLAAGAASLVATLWAVEDHSTAQLMEAFYGRLAAGAAKGAALRQAQIELLHGDGRYRHPYFWAPFFLVGDAGNL